MTSTNEQNTESVMSEEFGPPFEAIEWEDVPERPAQDPAEFGLANMGEALEDYGRAIEPVSVSAAAAVMGSRRTPRKATSSRANGAKGGRPTTEQRARKRVAASPSLSKHEATIFYDWPDWNAHMKWISTAPVAEIVDWAEVAEGE